MGRASLPTWFEEYDCLQASVLCPVHAQLPEAHDKIPDVPDVC